MARGRFISNTLGESDKFAELDDHGQRMLYMLLVTHADCEGRLKGNPRWIRGKVLTYIDYATSDIEAALARMHEVGLVNWYEVEGKKYLEVTKFHEHNKVRRDEQGVPTHEAPSAIPEPPQSHYVATTERVGPTPLEVEVEVKEEVEVEGEDPDHSEDRMARAFETRTPQANERHRVRAEVRRLAGQKFAARHEDDLTAWSRWSNQQLRDLWDAADPAKWPGETGKRRTWLFEDLLNEERSPPVSHDGEIGRPFSEILAEAQADLGAN